MIPTALRLLEARVARSRSKPHWLRFVPALAILAASGWLGVTAWQAHHDREVAVRPPAQATTLPGTTTTSAVVVVGPSAPQTHVSNTALILSACGSLSGFGSMVIAFLSLREREHVDLARA